jgi:hypothetical protein
MFSMIIDIDSTRENCNLTACLASSRGACQLLASNGNAGGGGGGWGGAKSAPNMRWVESIIITVLENGLKGAQRGSSGKYAYLLFPCGTHCLRLL